MKVRIIGTSTKKYLDNFYKVFKQDKQFILAEEGWSFYIASFQPYKKLLKFSSDVTRRQNIEVWEGLGLVVFNKNQIFMNYKDNDDIWTHMKKSLIQNSSKEYIQSYRNMKLLAIEYYSGALNEKLIQKMNIQQKRNSFSINKLRKEISHVEKEMSKDSNFLLQVRKVLYNNVSQFN